MEQPSGVPLARPAVILLAVAVFCSLAQSSHAQKLDEVRSRGVLRWGADAEGGGPYVYPRDDNPAQVQGFEVELADLLAKQLGVKAEFVQGQWEKLPDLLERGDIDIVLNGYEWTPTWAERFSASVPYYIYELQMLTRKDDTRFPTLESFRRPVSGRKPRIAVLGGSAAETWVRTEYGENVDVILYEGVTDAMRAVELSLDNVDATLQDLPIVSFYESRFPRLRRLGEPVAPGYYVILARKSDHDLISALNDAIFASSRDGAFPAVLARYGLWNEAQRRRGLMTDADGNFQLDPVATGDAGTQRRDTSTSFWNRIPQLLLGAVMTVFLAVTSMPLAISAGILIAIGRLYGPRRLARPLAVYVELVRGTPLVLQLYLIFFVLPEIGIALPPVVAAILGLSINYSAYEAEIYRAGMQAIPRGQMEAALSLGMSRGLALRRIIVPQAFRLVIPPVMNDFIALFKDTAVCSVITVVELSKTYYIHARSTGAVLELGVVTALLYLAMSYPLAILVGRIERRMAEKKRDD